MTGRAGRVQAARGRLARLVIVVAVLAGLGLVVGLPCIDGMATAMPVAGGAHSADAAVACGSPAAMAVSHTAEPAGAGQPVPACAVSGAAALAHEGAAGSDGWGRVLATCLAFLVAVVAAVVVLRPGRFRGVVRMPEPAPVVVIRGIRPRAPSLAELCLLRT